MLEPDLIQTRGFRNIVRDGRPIGFEFNIRLTYYRGIFLSQLRPQNVVIDGKTIPKEKVVWVLNGHEHSYNSMRWDCETHWCPDQPATLRIYDGEGLKSGYHCLSTGYMYSSSYMPPQLQQGIDNDEIDPFLEMMFGQLKSERRMLLVC